MLIKNYYSIEGERHEDEKFFFSIKLNPACDVYKGHFPDMPVSPGVCNIQMIKECACKATGKNLLLKTISQCKFISLVTPDKNQYLQLELQMTKNEEGNYKTRAILTDKETTFLDMKAEFKEI